MTSSRYGFALPPGVRSATHQLFFESSLVWNRRFPQRWVAEFTSQVQCSATVTRRMMAHLVSLLV